ncbi:glutaredoxin family protein [Desulfopila sp. IMCC35008]|uniref:glutaredoxin family protein n=1 Tax=Desulfopila sp. IMCC35008 TaxID=2653858 RepID=UPI0013D247AE|nr:glutaredoxin family protein [Desulfopila sp. IMCC35008]
MFSTRLNVLILLFFAVLLPNQSVSAKEEPVEIYFFYSKSCPHCHEQIPLMQALEQNNPELKILAYEIHDSNAIWDSFLKKHNIQYRGFPRTFIGDISFVGYSSSAVALEYSDVVQGYQGNRVQIVKAIEKLIGHKVSLGDFLEKHKENTVSTASFWPLLLPLLYLFSFLFLRRYFTEDNRKRLWQAGLAATFIISFFLFLAQLPGATVQAYAQSLPYPLFVGVIALADGFNPCAFTVLIILLSLLTYTKSRKDMILLGGTFIVTSAVMYFIFIMVLVLIGGFFLEQYGQIIMLLLGAGIAAAGILNVKDFFFFDKGGVSLSLSEKQKLQFSQKASGIVKGLGKKGGKLYLAIGGTIMLGIVVNLVELGCTAILPVVYLTTLVSRYDGYTAYSIWTAFYCLIYILPLLAILANFIYFFKSVRLSEQQGRLLKLTSGAFMLFFGILMIFKPEMLTFSWL